MSIVSHDIHLVDVAGFDVPTTEKNGVPHDPTDAACWPESNEVDGWFWSVPPDDLAELEALETERLADLADAPSRGYGAQVWSQSFALPAISGGSPEPFEPTPADWQDYHDWCLEVERRDALRRDENARFPLYGNE